MIWRLIQKPGHKKAVDWNCFVKKMFSKISQNSLENTCVGVSYVNKVAGLFHGTPPLATSVRGNTVIISKIFCILLLKKCPGKILSKVWYRKQKRDHLIFGHFKLARNMQNILTLNHKFPLNFFQYWRHVDVHKNDFVSFYFLEISILFILKNTGLFQWNFAIFYSEKLEVSHNLMVIIKLVLNLMSCIFMFI